MSAHSAASSPNLAPGQPSENRSQQEWSEQAVRAMRSADLYPQRQPPEVIETHISTLFLSDDVVYKLKKPVDFGFLDYSTLQKRLQACQAEVALNRRLAPDVYQGVVAVGHDDQGRWQIDSNVPPLEWMVKMKRLPDDRCLSNMIRQRSWNQNDVDATVALLTNFYASLEPVHVDSYHSRVLQHVLDNQSELESPGHRFHSPLVRRVHAAQRQFLFLHGDLLDRRVTQGRIVEGHGDLRAEHLYLTKPPVVIDGIEFSRELRLIDIADELCFFAITCEMLGAPEIGQQVLEGCCAGLHDVPEDALLDFYRAYRACVRAKVEVLRIDQAEGSDRQQAIDRAGKYLHLADGYARQFASPLAIIVRGLSGTGKTTFASALADQIGATHLSTDQIRKGGQAVGKDPSYDQTARRKVYESMYDQGVERLGDGESVVLDGTHLQASPLHQAAERLHREGGRVVVVNCVCPGEVAIERIEARANEGTSPSDANVEVFHQQRELIELVPSELECIEIDTTVDQQTQLQRIKDVLGRVSIGR
ncbi:AAA family ATPase [Roseiconus nitratireducens]|uniref:AAA family ATPase n=1 Tax=Roseiconus nitratireducens TaxID=2605748 RepID=A0A5M6D4X5_9BACT|nr:bifunctional aminoglycoside phosphotransferase/ATP-binding protein [Roseiconus nitratireducens]KAA5542568.1 AAA family ATPase [Roseiconus nitratireducens]